MSFVALENPRTGEYGVLRRPAGSADGTTVADLYARPGAVVPHEHIHPAMTETFTVVRGRLTLKMDGTEQQVAPGDRLAVPPGTPHAWWNTGRETAWVIVEADPGARFEALIKTMFFLATDGKTDGRGRPGLLQGALVAREFDDAHRLTRPRRTVQRLVFGTLAPIARLRGLRGLHPEYLDRVTDILDDVEALPPAIVAKLPEVCRREPPARREQ